MNGNEKIPGLTAEDLENLGNVIHDVGKRARDNPVPTEADLERIREAQRGEQVKWSPANRQQRRAAERAQNRARRAAQAGRYAGRRELIATVTLTDPEEPQHRGENLAEPTAWLEES